MTIWKNLTDLERDFESIKANIEFRDTRIKYLEEENRRLKSEQYKYEELAKMREELQKTKEDLYRGFPISKEAKEKIDKFISEHSKPYLRVSTIFRYEFYPTPLGTVGTIIASNGDKLTFQEIE